MGGGLRGCPIQVSRENLDFFYRHLRKRTRSPLSSHMEITPPLFKKSDLQPCSARRLILGLVCTKCINTDNVSLQQYLQDYREMI